MSTNLYYNTANYPNKVPPQTDLVRDILLAYKYGIKNLYYTNTFDGDTQTVLGSATEVKKAEPEVEVEAEDDGCAGGACRL
jgi:ribonucleoside-diphosphate reductase alpha chain